MGVDAARLLIEVGFFREGDDKFFGDGELLLIVALLVGLVAFWAVQ